MKNARDNSTLDMYLTVSMRNEEKHRPERAPLDERVVVRSHPHKHRPPHAITHDQYTEYFEPLCRK